MCNFNFSSMIFMKNFFEEEIRFYKYKIKKLNPNNFIYIIEDSLILLLSFVPDFAGECSCPYEFLTKYSVDSYINELYSGDKYESLKIEELVPNEIGFKFNATKFAKLLEDSLGIEYASVHIHYERFKGFFYPSEIINRLLPELQLKERFDNWEGNEYKFIVFELDTPNLVKEYVVSYTAGSIQSCISNIAKQYIKTGTFGGENTRYIYNSGFSKGLIMWKGVKRKDRLEKFLKYCVVTRKIKKKDDVWRYADKLLTDAYNGAFENFDKTHFVNSANKWITEELVFKLVKKICRDYKVIYQYRPFFLKSSLGGQMSYDIFISGLNIAVEYQGKQHFEPVAFFGGEPAFENLKKRDKEKQELSRKNGIKIIYINYWEDVTIELINEKIGLYL